MSLLKNNVRGIAIEDKKIVTKKIHCNKYSVHTINYSMKTSVLMCSAHYKGR